MCLRQSSLEVQTMFSQETAQFKTRQDSCRSMNSEVSTAYNENIQFSLACNKEKKKTRERLCFLVFVLFVCFVFFLYCGYVSVWKNWCWKPVASEVGVLGLILELLKFELSCKLYVSLWLCFCQTQVFRQELMDEILWALV